MTNQWTSHATGWLGMLCAGLSDKNTKEVLCCKFFPIQFHMLSKLLGKIFWELVIGSYRKLVVFCLQINALVTIIHFTLVVWTRDSSNYAHVSCALVDEACFAAKVISYPSETAAQVHLTCTSFSSTKSWSLFSFVSQLACACTVSILYRMTFEIDHWRWVQGAIRAY